MPVSSLSFLFLPSIYTSPLGRFLMFSSILTFNIFCVSNSPSSLSSLGIFDKIFLFIHIFIASAFIHQHEDGWFYATKSPVEHFYSEKNLLFSFFRLASFTVLRCAVTMFCTSTNSHRRIPIKSHQTLISALHQTIVQTLIIVCFCETHIRSFWGFPWPFRKR